MTVSRIQTNFGVMRVTLVAVLVSIVVLSAGADATGLLQDMSSFRMMGSRADGTAGEKLASDYIVDRLDELGIPFERQSMTNLERGHSFSDNIVADIPGTLPGLFILAAPIDNGSYAVSLLLELASQLVIQPPNHSIRLLFLGAERGPTQFHPYGSRSAIENTEADTQTFTLYLDSEQVPRFWRMRVGGNRIVAPYWFVKVAGNVFGSEFLSFRLRGTDVQVARLGLQGDTGPLTAWIESGIPTILLEGFGSVSGTEQTRNILKILGAIRTLDQRIAGIPDFNERNYVFFRPVQGMMPRGVPELTIVSIFLIVVTGVLVVLLLQARDVRLNFKRFSGYWWTWPLLLIMVFLFLFLSTLVIEETTLIADFPDIWIHAPGIFIFFKLTMAGSISLIFLLLMRGLPLPRSPHYYSYAAVGSSMLSLLVITSFDVTLTAYPLWTLINLILFTATRKEHRKAIFLTSSVLPYVIGLVVIVSEPYRTIIRSLIFSRIAGNIVITLLLLPLIFAFTSMSYWRHHYHRTRKSILTPVTTITLSLSALVTLVWILGLTPYNAENPQPVMLTDTINLNDRSRRLELESPRPVGDATLTLGSVNYPLENIGRNAEVRTTLSSIPLEVDKSSRTFLGRRTETVRIVGEKNPQSLTLRLHSNRPFTLHEASQPFDMNPAGTNAEIYVGLNPPLPFELRFTVNANAELVLDTEIRWDNPENPPGIVRADLKAETSRVARLETALDPNGN